MKFTREKMQFTASVLQLLLRKVSIIDIKTKPRHLVLASNFILQEEHKAVVSVNQLLLTLL